VRAAESLGVNRDRFRRWIAFHEVAHAAEFAAAPWLADYVESRIERSVEALSDGRMDRTAFAELDATMTAVEGYAELVMDRAFDGETEDLRARLDNRRNASGPVTRLLRRALGLGVKREQYERGGRFLLPSQTPAVYGRRDGCGTSRRTSRQRTNSTTRRAGSPG